jgi:hypothetical protein
MEVLAQLDIGTNAQLAALDRFHAPPIRNTKGVQTGSIAAGFTLVPRG